MENKMAKLSGLLDSLQKELSENDLWETEIPSPEALSSEEPFCIDTLNLTQWIQWIFIPKLSYLIENKMTLPDYSAVHEIAEEAFKGMDTNMEHIKSLIKKIDETISSEKTD